MQKCEKLAATGVLWVHETVRVVFICSLFLPFNDTFSATQNI
jgi:hypothetical protein